MKNEKKPTTKYNTPTNELAIRFGVKGDTVRRNLCVSGHFLGLRPLKLPNNRLLWPDVFPEDLIQTTRRNAA